MSMPSSKEAGTVKDVWRYPVKSMGGEALFEALVTDGGIIGDRAYAVVDRANGKVASAKLPKKWGKLVELSASFVQPPGDKQSMPPVRISWPEGAHSVSSDADLDGRLSQTLGRAVSLTTRRPASVSLERLDPLVAEETILDIGDLMMEGRFSDYAAFHLVTTATLSELARVNPESRFDAARFRPNMVIETPGEHGGFVENGWVGRTLCIGDQVRLRVTDPTPRCSVPTLGQKNLPKDPQILRTLVDHNRLPVPLLDGEVLPCAGIYAFVVQGGVLRRGDPVRVM